MNPRGIVTPEAVVLDFETAGIASRGIARTIDALIQLAALFALLLIVGLAIEGSAGVVLAIVGVAAVVVGYPILCEVLMRGRSPGKAVFGLRAVTVEGAPATARHAFIRSSVGIVDFLIPPIGVCAVISSLLSPKSQRLGDLVAGTIVLRERAASSPPAAIWFRPPAGLEGYAHTLDVSTVTEPQFAVVRSFLLRVQDLAPEARSAMAIRLRRRSPPPCTTRPPEACTRSSSSCASPPPTSDADGRRRPRRVPAGRFRPRRPGRSRLRPPPRPRRRRPRRVVPPPPPPPTPTDRPLVSSADDVTPT